MFSLSPQASLKAYEKTDRLLFLGVWKIDSYAATNKTIELSSLYRDVIQLLLKLENAESKQLNNGLFDLCILFMTSTQLIRAESILNIGSVRKIGSSLIGFL